MKKCNGVVCLIALTTVAVAQDFEQQVPQVRFQELQESEFWSLNQRPNLRRFNIDVPNLELQIPKEYTVDDRARILAIFAELKQACPACSTGGTIGGGTITGGNSGGNGGPLFPIAPGNSGGLNPTVTITRFEYDELKRKAALYDSSVSENGE